MTSTFPSHRLVRTVLAAVVLLVGLSAAQAAPPADVAAVTRYLPENTRLVASIKLTPEVRDWFFSSLFFNPDLQKRIANEQSQQFAKATGLDILKDVDGLLLAVGEPAAKGVPPAAIVFARAKGDVPRVGKAMADDAKLQKQLKKTDVKGNLLLSHEQFESAFVPNLVAIGASGTVKPVLERGTDAVSNAAFLDQIPTAVLDKALCYISLSLPPSMMANAASNPQFTQMGGGILARLQHLTVALDDKDLSITFKLDSKDAAAVASDQLKGMVTTAKGVLEGLSKAPTGDQASPLDLIHPKAIFGRVAALTGLTAVTAINVTVDGERTRLALAKEKVPAFRGGMSVFLVGVALAGGALAGLSQNQAVSERDACFNNQRLLSGALELYNADKKKQARLEEVADELVALKYLPEGKPEDPGQGQGSFKNYVSMPDGTVTCKVHGRPEQAVTVPSPAPAASESPAPSASPEAGGEEEDKAPAQEAPKRDLDNKDDSKKSDSQENE